jgi:hypothetical protein
LAERAIEIFDRTKHIDVGLASFETTLVPAATAYIAVYDQVCRYQPNKKAEVAQAANSFAELHKRIRVWMGTLAQEMPDFDASDLIGTPGVPERLLADAKRLIDQASEAGETMSFGAALIADLRAAMETAQKQWIEARTAQSKYQSLQAEVREAADTLNRQLVAFRRTMRVCLGSTNVDYRKLLFPRGRGAAPEEETTEEATSTTSEASASTAPPAETTTPNPGATTIAA